MKIYTYELKGRRTSIIAALVLLVTAVFLLHPLRVLCAGYYYSSAMKMLDGSEEWGIRVKDLTVESVEDYLSSAALLESATWYQPSNPLHHYVVGDIYLRLYKWLSLLESLDAEPNSLKLTTEDAFRHATVSLTRAIMLEPTNPDYHLALGMLNFAPSGDYILAEKELQMAVEVAPLNAPIRYKVTMEYLLAGRNGYALEHARALAEMSGEYKVPLHIRGTEREELHPFLSHRAMLKSYLFAAFEAAWRASGDPEVVRGIAPGNPYSEEALALFFEWRGIDG